MRMFRVAIFDAGRAQPSTAPRAHDVRSAAAHRIGGGVERWTTGPPGPACGSSTSTEVFFFSIFLRITSTEVGLCAVLFYWADIGGIGWPSAAAAWALDAEHFMAAAMVSRPASATRSASIVLEADQGP